MQQRQVDLQFVARELKEHRRIVAMVKGSKFTNLVILENGYDTLI